MHFCLYYNLYGLSHFRAPEELSLDELFTKSHIEREKILHQRKEAMLVLARKR